MAERAEHDPERVAEAAALLGAFAQETGLSGDRPPRRYLWTDAHAGGTRTAP